MSMDKRSYYWIKLDTAYLSNSKFLMLPINTRYHYIALYLLACEGDSGGVLVQNEEVMSVKEMALLLHEEENILLESITKLVQAGLIVIEDDGAYTINRFMEDQGKVSFGAEEDKKKKQWRERQAKHRNKVRNLTNGIEEKEIDTHSDGNIDKDLMIEKDEEIYEEIYEESDEDSDEDSDEEIDKDIDEDIEGHSTVTCDNYVTSNSSSDINLFRSFYNKERGD